MSKRLIRSPCVGLVTAVLWAMTLGACRSGPVVRLADDILYVPAGQPFCHQLGAVSSRAHPTRHEPRLQRVFEYRRLTTVSI